ncbi:hypothetical protein Q5752_002607 [Cryptotrichosporon argae]
MVNKSLPPLPLDVHRPYITFMADDSLPTPPFSNLSFPLSPSSQLPPSIPSSPASASSPQRTYATRHANASSATVLTVHTPSRTSPGTSTTTISPAARAMASPADKPKHRWLRGPSTDSVSSGSFELRNEPVSAGTSTQHEPKRRLWQSTAKQVRTPPSDKVRSRVDVGPASPTLARKQSSGVLLFGTIGRIKRWQSESPSTAPDDSARGNDGGLWSTPGGSEERGGSRDEQAGLAAASERAERTKAFNTLGREHKLVHIVPRDDAGDKGVSRPFNVNHDLHVSPDLGNMPASWLDALRSQGLAEADLMLIAAARRAQLSTPLKPIQAAQSVEPLLPPEPLRLYSGRLSSDGHRPPRRSLSVADFRDLASLGLSTSFGPLLSPTASDASPSPRPKTPKTPKTPKSPRTPKTPRTPGLVRSSSAAVAVDGGRKRLSDELKGFKDLKIGSEDDEWAAGILGAWASPDGNDEVANPAPAMAAPAVTSTQAPPPAPLTLAAPPTLRSTLSVPLTPTVMPDAESPSPSSLLASPLPSPTEPIPVPPLPLLPTPVPPSPPPSAASVSDKETDGVSRVSPGPRSTYAESDADWACQSLPPPRRASVIAKGTDGTLDAREPHIPARKSSDSFGVHYSAIVRQKSSASFGSIDDEDLVTPHGVGNVSRNGARPDADNDDDADDEYDEATQCSAARYSITSSVFSSIFKHARLVSGPYIPPVPRWYTGPVPPTHPMVSSLELLAVASTSASVPAPTPPASTPDSTPPAAPTGPAASDPSPRSAAHLSFPASAHSHSLPATRPGTPDDHALDGGGVRYPSPALPAWPPARPLGPPGSAERDALLRAIERAGADERASIALGMLSSHRAVARMRRVKEEGDDAKVGEGLDALDRAAQLVAQGEL